MIKIEKAERVSAKEKEGEKKYCKNKQEKRKKRRKKGKN